MVDLDRNLRRWIDGKLITAQELMSEGEDGTRAAKLMVEAIDATVHEIERLEERSVDLGETGDRFALLCKLLGRQPCQ